MGSRAGSVLVAAVLLLAALPACGRDEPAVPAGPLRIATGTLGGVYYKYGNAIANLVRQRVPQLRPEVLETDASRANLRLVDEGAAEIGFAQADTADEAFNNGAKVVALARVYDDYLHLVVPEASAVTSLDGLRTRRVSIGTPESGTRGTVTRLFELADIDPDTGIVPYSLNPAESAAALLAGQIDAFFYPVGLPADTVKDLAAKMPIRLVSLGDWAAGMRSRFGPFYVKHTVPASTYGLKEPADTMGIPNYLVVSPRMPAATAYALTRALFEGRSVLADTHPAAARLNPREAINTYPLELHEGSKRWYREDKR